MLGQFCVGVRLLFLFFFCLENGVGTFGGCAPNQHQQQQQKQLPASSELMLPYLWNQT